MFLAAKYFWGRRTPDFDVYLKIAVTVEHVAKFGNNRPSDLLRLSGEKINTLSITSPPHQLSLTGGLKMSKISQSRGKLPSIEPLSVESKNALN